MRFSFYSLESQKAKTLQKSEIFEKIFPLCFKPVRRFSPAVSQILNPQKNSAEQQRQIKARETAEQHSAL